MIRRRDLIHTLKIMNGFDTLVKEEQFEEKQESISVNNDMKLLCKYMLVISINVYALLVINLKKVSTHTTIVVISDDPVFLAGVVKWFTKGRLLVWSTRFLVITRLSLSQLQLHYTVFSKMNIMLIIINNNTTTIKCNMYIHVPFSSQQTQPLRVASWTPLHGLLLTSHHSLFPEKFSKFANGPNLLVASEGNPFSKMILTNDHKSPGRQKFDFTGPVPELVSYLAKALNFSYTYVRPPDGFFGTSLGNGSWSGMVGMVMREEVVIASGPFILSEDRAEVVDFTVAMMLDYWRIMGARGLPEVDPWSFVFPLAPLVWAVILAMLMMLAASLFLMHSSFCHKVTGQGNWLNVSFDYIRILLQQDMTMPTYWWWERMMLVMWMMVTLVLTRSYSGNLMALLAVRHISEPYQSRRQVLDDPSVTMIWLKGSATGTYLQLAESGIYREIADAEKIGRLIFKTHAEVPESINTLVRRGDHVLIDVGNALGSHISEEFTKTGKCSFYSSKEEFLPLIFGMIGPTDHPIIPAFNERIMSMTEAGLFFHWMKASEPNSTVCYHSPTKITVKTALSLSNVWGMFVILVVGIAISSLTLFLELMIIKIQLAWRQIECIMMNLPDSNVTITVLYHCYTV
nr:glutamate receptor-like [Cherax quadricarinatus]